MSDKFTTRRYLLNFDTRQLGQVFTDVLVIGGGVAGLRAAIEASQDAYVVVTTKDDLADSNTMMAQGGIATVSAEADSVESHVADTLAVGCGLSCEETVHRMVAEGPVCVEELVGWGARFDHENGTFALGMEGGHSVRRVRHAAGDATGREMGRALQDHMRKCRRIRLFDHCFVIDLVVDEGRCAGALCHHEKYGHQIIWARQTILASGGAGQLFRETTNPRSATADGLAMAYRAGARIRDLEFVQFHPTALYIAGAARTLISEAVRGEGAYLVDRDGHRFMPDYHPDAELAPRDIVSRAILSHMVATSTTTAYLDVRHFPAGQFAKRFPNIAQLCRDFDIDVSRVPIPVRPAAHYMIGGVAVDPTGRSSIEGLLACGEAASTCVHGANRLASNSLLEGLVFGKHVGRLAVELVASDRSQVTMRTLSAGISRSSRTDLNLFDICSSLRALCWRNLGIDRTGQQLAETIEIIDFWGRYVMDKVLDDRRGWETQNMLTVARGIALFAQAREESRGVHFRRDLPETDDGRFLGHFSGARTDASLALQFDAMGA